MQNRSRSMNQHPPEAGSSLPTHTKIPGRSSELRPETWTRLMVAVMRLPVGPDPGILPGSGP